MLFLAALSLVSHSIVLEDTAEIVEVNRVYCGRTGKRQFAQIMGWNDDGVDWWRIVNHVPVSRKIGGRWHVTFIDPKCGRMRRLITPTVHHSWSTWDREVENRSERPQQMRRELRKR